MSPNPGITPMKKSPPAKKKTIDVFWMDDEEDIAEFKQEEAEEKANSNWQDISDPREIVQQLDLGMFGIPGMSGTFPEDEAGWEHLMQEFDREMQQMTRQGSLTQRASMAAFQRLIRDQQKGGVRGWISRLFTDLVERVFKALTFGRPNPRRSRKKDKRKIIKTEQNPSPR